MKIGVHLRHFSKYYEIAYRKVITEVLWQVHPNFVYTDFQ